MLLNLAGAWAQVSPKPRNPAPPASPQGNKIDEKIVNYIRERFGVPDTVKLSQAPARLNSIGREITARNPTR